MFFKGLILVIIFDLFDIDDILLADKYEFFDTTVFTAVQTDCAWKTRNFLKGIYDYRISS